jgi:hypothetical protein
MPMPMPMRLLHVFTAPCNSSKYLRFVFLPRIVRPVPVLHVLHRMGRVL